MFYVFYTRSAGKVSAFKMVDWFMVESEAKAFAERRNRLCNGVDRFYYVTEFDASARELVHIQNHKNWNRNS